MKEQNNLTTEELELKSLNTRLSLALQSGEIGVWDWDLKTNETTWDDCMFKIYGIERQIPMPYEVWAKAVFPEDLPLAEASLERAISNKAIDKVEFRICRTDGRVRHIHSSEDVILDNKGNVIRVVGASVDITEKKEMEIKLNKANQKLKELSYTDALTNIANRRSFEERLIHEVNSSNRTGSPLCFLMLDIDYFKQYNDGYGHENGDLALEKVAKIIECSLSRNTDFVARYGGEEFAVILPHTPLKKATLVANKILKNVLSAGIEHSFSKGVKLLTVSIGISSTKFGSSHLLAHADNALYQAKENGRNRYEVYSV